MSSLSYRDLTGVNLNERPDLLALITPGMVIEKTCFAQESPDTVCLPADLVATLQHCVLDNCVIPIGCTVIGGTAKRILVQNDMWDWEVDGTNTPVSPVNAKLRTQLGISNDPADLPAQFIRRERLLAIDYGAQAEAGELAARFFESPKITKTEQIETVVDTLPATWDAMVAEQHFYPFDAEPKATKSPAIVPMRLGEALATAAAMLVANADNQLVAINKEPLVDKDKNPVTLANAAQADPLLIVLVDSVVIQLTGMITWVTIEAPGPMNDKLGNKYLQNSPQDAIAAAEPVVLLYDVEGI